MTTTETAYTLDNTWTKAQRRLTLFEEALDPATTSRLTDLGVGAGWRCLEVATAESAAYAELCARLCAVAPTKGSD